MGEGKRVVECAECGHETDKIIRGFCPTCYKRKLKTGEFGPQKKVYDLQDRNTLAGWSKYMRKYPYHFKSLFSLPVTKENIKAAWMEIQQPSQEALHDDRKREKNAHWECVVCPTCGKTDRIRTTKIGTQYLYCDSCRYITQTITCPVAESYRLGWK